MTVKEEAYQLALQNLKALYLSDDENGPVRRFIQELWRAMDEGHDLDVLLPEVIAMVERRRKRVQ
jgi:hypothetical protein